MDPGSSRISKSRACTECKRHKIKCERRPGTPDCVRCHRQGIRCVLNNHLQRMIEEDSDWKRTANEKTSQLQAAVAELLQRAQLPPLDAFGENGSASVNGETGASTALQQQQQFDSNVHGPSPNMISTMDMTRENSQEPENEETELVSAPMKSLFEVTKLRNLRSDLPSLQRPNMNQMEEDFISRGVVSLEEAERLFTLFNSTLSQFLWGGIALVHSNLTSVRQSSSLLSAAILTVAALHVPNHNEVFDSCYMEFITIVSASTLNRYHTLDEIRGLCIGAFWLSDLSWKLSGHCVRIATEMSLHQSMARMMRGKPDQYERAQLWYLLYVCDHHFSIAYGRPPVIHESPAITSYDIFLRSPQAKDGDVRLIAQVALFVILTKAYHAFGSDDEQGLAEEDFALMRSYNVDLEQWRIAWQPRSANSVYVASYPSKGVVLHYHFSKFQLNSMSLRAIPPSSHLSMDRKESANIAISSAMATLNFVLEEPDIRGAIVGVPLFTHAMVAFCAVFLLKVAWKWNSAHLNINTQQVQDLVQKIIELMSRVSAGKKHLSYHIASGLAKMLDRLQRWSASQQGQTGQILNFTPPSLPPEMAFDTFDTYGFELDDSWNQFSSSALYLSNQNQNGYNGQGT